MTTCSTYRSRGRSSLLRYNTGTGTGTYNEEQSLNDDQLALGGSALAGGSNRRRGASATHKSSVKLRVYDLSNGSAAAWSSIVLGKKIEGIWHTGVEAFGWEYFYGSGIVCMKPADVLEVYAMTLYGVHHLGQTKCNRENFENYLMGISGDFSAEFYNLLEWNCNNFSDIASKYLLGRGIPKFVLDLPSEVKSTIAGKFIAACISALAPSNTNLPTHPKHKLTGGDEIEPVHLHRTFSSLVNFSNEKNAGVPQSYGEIDYAPASCDMPSWARSTSRQPSLGHKSRGGPHSKADTGSHDLWNSCRRRNSTGSAARRRQSPTEYLSVYSQHLFKNNKCGDSSVSRTRSTSRSRPPAGAHTNTTGTTTGTNTGTNTGVNMGYHHGWG
eukprot:Lankesteria_metandrocarpae@DN9545_c0_g1_i1.p1